MGVIEIIRVDTCNSFQLTSSILFIGRHEVEQRPCMQTSQEQKAGHQTPRGDEPNHSTISEQPD